MANTITVTGTVTRDHFVVGADLRAQSDGWWLLKAGEKAWIEALEPVNGSGKTAARFGGDALKLADHVEHGGGGFNAVVAMKHSAPDVEILYSDSGTYDADLEAKFVRLGIQYCWRGLYPVQDNLVTADPATRDKLVFKARPEQYPVIIPAVADVERAAASAVVLVNSDKHRTWVTGLAGMAARRRINLNFVLTPSLPAVYLWGAIIPNAQLLIAGWDEIGPALGISIPKTIDSGVETVRMLAWQPQAPGVHLTLGKNGVLVADRESNSVLHVRLKDRKCKDVEKHLVDHSRVCGCGDCYAGIVTLHTVTGRSSFGGGRLHESRQASAAIAGCAAAVQHLGYQGGLEPDDFEVSCVGDLGGGTGWGASAA